MKTKNIEIQTSGSVAKIVSVKNFPETKIITVLVLVYWVLKLVVTNMQIGGSCFDLKVILIY